MFPTASFDKRTGNQLPQRHIVFDFMTLRATEIRYAMILGVLIRTILLDPLGDSHNGNIVD